MRRIVITLSFLLAFGAAAFSQEAAVAFCALDKDIDFKTAQKGDPVVMHVTQDLASPTHVLLPRGTTVLAHISDAQDAKSVSLVLDRAELKDGRKVNLMGIIAAVAVPKGDLTSDPFYGMNHSTEPMATGHDPGGSFATSGAAAQTAIQKGGANEPKTLLTVSSQGSIGIDGLSLNWILDKPPATTVFTSKKKNLKLHRGTEMLLRMAPPQI